MFFIGLPAANMNIIQEFVLVFCSTVAARRMDVLTCGDGVFQIHLMKTSQQMEI